MDITRDEAEVIFNLIQKSDGDTVSEGNLAVLHKIKRAFPAMLTGTKYLAILADDARKKETIKKSALAKIAELLDDAKAKVAEATKVAKAAGVGFELLIGDPDQSSYFDPREGWNASNC